MRSVPAVLPLMMEPWSITTLDKVWTPPPNPAALFPEIVLLWMENCTEPGDKLAGWKMRIPQP